jgi:hypothetical protein
MGDSAMKETFRCEYVKCGKAACQTCPHGPYWYAYRKFGNKTCKRYVGKLDPREPVKDKSPHRMDEIFNPKTASLDLAWEILGVGENSNQATCRDAFRTLTKLHHPDRGGSDDVFKRINVAWSYLRARHGW